MKHSSKKKPVFRFFRRDDSVKRLKFTFSLFHIEPHIRDNRIETNVNGNRLENLSIGSENEEKITEVNNNFGLWKVILACAFIGYLGYATYSQKPIEITSKNRKVVKPE